MSEDTRKFDNIIQIDEAQVRDMKVSFGEVDTTIACVRGRGPGQISLRRIDARSKG